MEIANVRAMHSDSQLVDRDYLDFLQSQAVLEILVVLVGLGYENDQIPLFGLQIK